MASAIQELISKKPYEPPVLTVYGPVQKLTQASFPKRGLDGGGGGSMIYTGVAPG
ncbi:MAG TPA: lasso RiPP family leader peptide-containing protein [Candidatus Acidoferrales bacterium]